MSTPIGVDVSVSIRIERLNVCLSRNGDGVRMRGEPEADVTQQNPKPRSVQSCQT